jgi:FkbM family methyltransferase
MIVPNAGKRKMNRTRIAQWILASIPTRKRIFQCNFGNLNFLFEASRKDDLFCHAKKGTFDNFESGALQYWMQVAKESQSVLDIGAYSGIYSIIAGLAGANVVSFEPNQYKVPSLTRNLALNELPTSSVHNVALGSGKGIGALLAPRMRFHKNPKFNGSGVQLDSAATGRNLSSWESIATVQIECIDNFLTKSEMLEVGIIKIDVEGSELSVLQGSQIFLQTSNAQILVECLDANQLLQVSKLLLKYNYKEIKKFGKNYLFSKS